jgi:hypothetical protein
VARYAGYLESQGAHKEAEWYRTEADAGSKVKQIVDSGAAMSPINTSVPGIIILSGLCILLFSNLLIILLFYALSQVRGGARYRHLLLVLAAVWQWRVITLWGTSFFEWANMFEEKPLPIPGAIAYTSFLPLAFLGLGVALAIAALQNRRKRDVTSPETRPAAAPYLIAAAGFSLLYLIVFGADVVQENRLRIALDKTVTHEGRYFAELVHKPWPSKTQ